MNTTDNTKTDAFETRDIGIAGMTCDKCVTRVEKALRAVAGVKDVRVNRETARATVTFERASTNVPELHEAILKSGYQPSAQPA